jgi:hypothetical protein
MSQDITVPYVAETILINFEEYCGRGFDKLQTLTLDRRDCKDRCSIDLKLVEGFLKKAKFLEDIRLFNCW